MAWVPNPSARSTPGPNRRIRRAGRVKTLRRCHRGGERDGRVRRDEVLSVIGPNGAGKTSLLNMISGFYRPTSGAIYLDGRDITPATSFAGRRARRRPHFPEHRPVRRHDRPRQHHARPARAHALRRIRRADLLGICQEGGDRPPRPRRGTDRIARTAEHSQAAQRRPIVGLRKQVELGRALALDPKVLLLDEPMGGINQAKKEDMARFILK